MLYVTCSMITSVDLARYGVSGVKLHVMGYLVFNYLASVHMICQSVYQNGHLVPLKTVIGD